MQQLDSLVLVLSGLHWANQIDLLLRCEWTSNELCSKLHGNSICPKKYLQSFSAGRGEGGV